MSSDDDVDYSEIQSALGSIGLSAVLIFGATLLSQGLGFLTRVIMARHLPVDGYGNVVIGLSVLNLFGLAALAGMPAALSRYLPRQETDDGRRNILSSAFQIVGVLSVLIATIIYLTADPLANILFGNADLVWIIRIFAAVLPFYAMFKLSLGGFRGYEMTYPRILNQNILRPGLQLAGIVLFVTIGYGTTGIAFAYASAFAVVALVGLLLLHRISGTPPTEFIKRGSSNQYRKLLSFSLPLVASGAINVIAKHSDLIILGIFKSSTAVGIYEVSFRVAMFVFFSVTPAVGFLFQPIISRYHADESVEMMQKLYVITTRWVVVGTFPIFALFVLFPDQTLAFFFGSAYRDGQLALSILVVGFMLSQALGLTGNFLTSVGKTKAHMYISAGTMVINVAVNLALIPIYGILGAAIATALAQVFNNSVQLYVIFRQFGIHPFARNYIVPSALMGLSITALYLAPIPIGGVTFITGFIIASGLGVMYLLVVVGTRSVYLVELRLVDNLLERAGIPISITKYLRPFVR